MKMNKIIDLDSHYPVLQAFRKSNAQVRCLMGPVGSGKTRACCQELLTILLRQKQNENGWRTAQFAFIKHTIKSIYTTMFDGWNEFIGNSKLTNWNGKLGCYIFSIDSLKIIAKIYFIGLDRVGDDSDLKGLRLTAAWINEGYYIWNYHLINILIGRLGRYPTDNNKGYMIIDTNPTSVDHWIYTEIYQSKNKETKLFKQPAGRSPEAENRHNLAKLFGGNHLNYYLPKVEQWQSDPYRIKTDIDGEFGIRVDGQPIYPFFNTNRHVSEKSFDDYDKRSLRKAFYIASPIIVGIDTKNNPAASYMFYDSLNGKWIIFDEIVLFNSNCIVLAQKMKQKAYELDKYYNLSEDDFKYYVDPAGNQQNEIDSNTVIRLFRSEPYNLDAQEAHSNNAIETRRLSVAVNIMKDKLIVMNNCRYIRDGLSGGYCRKQLNTRGRIKFHSKADNNEYQHICEAMEYGFLGYRTANKDLFAHNEARERKEYLEMMNNLGYKNIA